MRFPKITCAKCNKPVEIVSASRRTPGSGWASRFLGPLPEGDAEAWFEVTVSHHDEEETTRFDGVPLVKADRKKMDFFLIGQDGLAFTGGKPTWSLLTVPHKPPAPTPPRELTPKEERREEVDEIVRQLNEHRAAQDALVERLRDMTE